MNGTKFEVKETLDLTDLGACKKGKLNKIKQKLQKFINKN
jgi:hypothetical protein